MWPVRIRVPFLSGGSQHQLIPTSLLTISLQGAETMFFSFYFFKCFFSVDLELKVTQQCGVAKSLRFSSHLNCHFWSCPRRLRPQCWPQQQLRPRRRPARSRPLRPLRPRAPRCRRCSGSAKASQRQRRVSSTCWMWADLDAIE